MLADKALINALHELQAGDYNHSWDIVNGIPEVRLSNDTLKAEALNLRGTFKSASFPFPVVSLTLSPGTWPVICRAQKRTSSSPSHSSPHLLNHGLKLRVFTWNWMISTMRLRPLRRPLSTTRMTPISTITADRVNDTPILQCNLLTSRPVYFNLGNFRQATVDYNNSVLLDDQFVFSHIQLAVAQYEEGHADQSMAMFEETILAFPERSEPLNN